MQNKQISKNKIGFALLLIVTVMISFACNGTVPPSTPSPGEGSAVTLATQALPTEIIPTLTPLPTSTPIPPTSIPPTNTSLPAPTFSLPAPTRINFAAGATYGNASGRIKPSQTQNFVLAAQQGQPMLASVSSPNNDVTMSIITGSGITLLPASQAWSNWQGTLPATQDYYIQIIGGASVEDYSLYVSIPSRIQFAPGAISDTVSGRTVDGYIASYVVAARGGQTMNILLLPEPNVAALTVWGFSDGQPYMRAHMGSTTFSMQLPSTQDYIIDVVPQAGQEVNFILRVEILN
jgi:hypothetical protein